MMEKIAPAFKEALQNAIPQEKHHPGFSQLFMVRKPPCRGALTKFGHPLTPNDIRNRWCKRSEDDAHSLEYVAVLGHLCRQSGDSAGI